jgi:predicted transglutaminase-like cysteine proteinase
MEALFEINPFVRRSINHPNFEKIEGMAETWTFPATSDV